MGQRHSNVLTNRMDFDQENLPAKPVITIPIRLCPSLEGCDQLSHLSGWRVCVAKVHRLTGFGVVTNELPVDIYQWPTLI